MYYFWHHPFLLLTILLIVPFSTVSQNISINDSLTATETSTSWRSPGGDFAFGFQQLEGKFVLAIWFDKIPNQTIVWYERSSYPVLRGSTIRLEARNGLVLRDPQGSVLYNSANNGGFRDDVALASMEDTGNFVLTGQNTSNILWESFRHPVDTILPTQTIEINQTLISRKTYTDFSQGRFRAIMDNTGNFLLDFKTVPSGDDFNIEYYSSQTSNGTRLLFDTTASILVVAGDGRPVATLADPSPSVDEYYYRATIDVDGGFTLYYHRKNFEGSPSWISSKKFPGDPESICKITVPQGSQGSGPCGYHSLCRVENDRPICECPQGFSLVDPSNSYGDCKSDFVQNCVQDENQECSITEIRGINFPNYDYELIRGTTEQECKDACLNDRFCNLAVQGGPGCWKKSLPVSNGRDDQSAITYFKRGNAITQSLPRPKSKSDLKTLMIVVSVLLGGSVFVNVFFASAACFGFFSIRNKIKLRNSNRHTGAANLRRFTYKQLVHSTNNFREEVGRGGFGIVYKGEIPDDPGIATAVKKLDRVAQDSEKEFRTEVEVIGQIHHRNVVRLLGFCNEGTNRLLVYEYMPNGNLATFLFSDVKPSWQQRTQMALGVARGLAYLHEECSTQIIHCDIKPQNILLDDNYTARISDFGLAKLLMLNQSKTVTNIRGTKGYVSPEWFRNTQITAKVDVYSFGVVLLEIVSCRKAVLDAEFGDGVNPILTEWAWECFVEGRLEMLVGFEEEAMDDGVLLERFVKVALWCIQEDAGLRPTMRQTCQMLEGTMDVARPPLSSSFFLTSHTYN